MALRTTKNFRRTISVAVNFFTEHGYTSADDLEFWQNELIKQAAQSFAPETAIQELVSSHLRSQFNRFSNRGGYAQFNKGVSRFSVTKVNPLLQDELNRRILAATHYIADSREKCLAELALRFSGWASSVPKGIGTSYKVKAEIKKRLAKPILSALKIERNTLSDQRNKMFSGLSEIIAANNEAIAGEWFSNWQQPGYDYREDHKDRHGLVYLRRDSWAYNEGLVKPAVWGFTDEITQPCEEPNCKCRYKFVYSLEDIPMSMLTAKGKSALATGKVA